MKNIHPIPSVYAYDNYRTYLSDCYGALKKAQKQFSFRYFAKQAGFASPNYLKMVIDGQRNLSIDSITKFSKALKLGSDESEFFENLVLYNQSKEHEDKVRLFKKLVRNRNYTRIHTLGRKKFEYYIHWYYAAVRELVGSQNFQDDPEWISQQLLPKITTDQAKEALRILRELGLIERGKDGRFHKTQAQVSSGPEAQSLAIKSFHREMLRIAMEAPDRVPWQERDMSGVMMRISSDRVDELKRRIQEFRKELLSDFEVPSEQSGRLYQFNVQLFPISEKEKK